MGRMLTISCGKRLTEMRSPTVEEIRTLGFEWPKNMLIEQCCETDGLSVDLILIIGRLMKCRSEIEDVLEIISARADFEQIYEIKRQADEHDEVIGYLREIQSAFEKRKLGPTDLLLPVWPLLGIPYASEARPLTKAEVSQRLESDEVCCAWTDLLYTHLHWLSRQEVKQRIQPDLSDHDSGLPHYGYLATEWCTNENKRILVFCRCYWPI